MPMQNHCCLLVLSITVSLVSCKDIVCYRVHQATLYHIYVDVHLDLEVLEKE